MPQNMTAGLRNSYCLSSTLSHRTVRRVCPLSVQGKRQVVSRRSVASSYSKLLARMLHVCIPFSWLGRIGQKCVTFRADLTQSPSLGIARFVFMQLFLELLSRPLLQAFESWGFVGETGCLLQDSQTNCIKPKRVSGKPLVIRCYWYRGLSLGPSAHTMRGNFAE